jgi:hypothetical protein
VPGCCLPPGVDVPSSSFEARFPGTIAPFVVIFQTPNAQVIVGPGLVKLYARSAPPDFAGPHPEAVLIQSPSPIIDPSAQDFCMTAAFSADTPLQSQATDIPAAATGIVGATDEVAGVVYDFASNSVFLLTRGPGGEEQFPLGAPDSAGHVWRVTGSAAAQAYTIQKDYGAPVPFVPVAGNYPQEPLAAAAIVSAESPGPLPARNRMVMTFWCGTAGSPPAMARPMAGAAPRPAGERVPARGRPWPFPRTLR